MSAEHLPEDPRRWPRDPYQILGVERRCQPLVARRAYTGLIRQFKPEQFPEQFRRIREAYDAVKRELEFFGSASTPANEENPGDAAAPAPANTPAAGVDLLHILWDKACSGQEEHAYAELRQMYEMQPHGSDLPARLFAMLLANPELDARRTPCDWLVRGVLAEGPWGPCRQLYRRKIGDHPEEALSPRFLGLLDDPSLRRNLVELLGWRWEALSRLDRTELIAKDLSNLRPQMERAEEETWVRILLKAADYLAWQRGSRLGPLCEEIDKHVHVHGVLAEDLSRLDFLRELSRSWHQLRNASALQSALLGVVPVTWTSLYENRHRILLPCRPVAEKPETALAWLDDLHRKAPLVTAHLGQALGWLCCAPADPRDEAALTSALQDYLGGLRLPIGDADYALFRRPLLQLCLAEVIAPETAAALIDPKRTSFVFQRIHDDWPLRVVCAAHRLVMA